MAAIYTFDSSLIESLANVGVHVCYLNGGTSKWDVNFDDFGIFL